MDLKEIVSVNEAWTHLTQNWAGGGLL